MLISSLETQIARVVAVIEAAFYYSLSSLNLQMKYEISSRIVKNTIKHPFTKL